jgi:hypothetical protein
MGPKGIGREGADLTHVAQSRNQWRAVVYTGMNLLCSLKFEGSQIKHFKLRYHCMYVSSYAMPTNENRG